MSRVVVVWGIALCAVAQAAPREVGEARVAGHLLVHFRDGGAHLVEGARLERTLAEVSLLHADDESDEGTARLLSQLAADPRVEWVEPERVRHRFSIDANDPLFSSQWALQLSRIPAAWARTRGSSDVTVAVLDTGILQHPDLKDRYLAGYDFISDPASAGDGNGRDPDPSDPGVADPSSSGLHGTHVAGIVAAQSDNHLGIAGVDWSCGLLPVRVLGIHGGQGSDSDIADAIRWAAGLHVDGVPDNPHPASVINMSFGGPGGSKTLQQAIDAAFQRGTIIVAAAGNDAADTASYAPAGLDHVIAVGAVLSNGKPTSYTNHGARVDVMGPGGDLYDGTGGGVISTLRMPNDGYTYGFLAGTSQAAPHVAGVAALMRAIDPTLDSDRARAILRASADPSGMCEDGCGGGLLDASGALAAVEAGCADGHCDTAARVPIALVGGCSVSGSVRSGGGGGLGLLFALLAVARAISRRRD